MKKLCLLCTFLFIFLFPASATAAETQTAPYANAWELYQGWYENYPDYISGIWSTDGGMNLTFGIAENADFESTKNEILSLIENDSTASFTQQKYSYNYLKQIQEYLNTFFVNYDPSLGLSSMGIYEMENCVGIDFLEDKKNDAAVIQFIEDLQSKYGDAVKINYSPAIVATVDILTEFNTATITPEEPTSNPLPVILICIAGIAVLCSVGSLVFIKKKKAAVLQTATGENMTFINTFTTKQAEALVRTATLTPSENADKKIQQ